MLAIIVIGALLAVYALLRLTLPHGPNGQHIHKEYP